VEVEKASPDVFESAITAGGSMPQAAVILHGVTATDCHSWAPPPRWPGGASAATRTAVAVNRASQFGALLGRPNAAGSLPQLFPTSAATGRISTRVAPVRLLCQFRDFGGSA
jgi:hypothetical protein